MTVMAALATRHRTRLVSVVLLALVAAGCGDGVDGDRRQLAIELAENLKTPPKYERIGEFEVRDPDLDAFSPQLGTVEHSWRPIGQDPEPRDTFASFDPVLREAGYRLVLVTDCSEDELNLVYWHPETGPAQFFHLERSSREIVVGLSASWGNKPLAAEAPEVDPPSCS